MSPLKARCGVHSFDRSSSFMGQADVSLSSTPKRNRRWGPKPTMREGSIFNGLQGYQSLCNSLSWAETLTSFRIRSRVDDRTHFYQEHPEIQFRSCSLEGIDIWAEIQSHPHSKLPRRGAHSEKRDKKPELPSGVLGFWSGQKSKPFSVSGQGQEWDC